MSEIEKRRNAQLRVPNAMGGIEARSKDSPGVMRMIDVLPEHVVLLHGTDTTDVNVAKSTSGHAFSSVSICDQSLFADIAEVLSKSALIHSCADKRSPSSCAACDLLWRVNDVLDGYAPIKEKTNGRQGNG